MASPLRLGVLSTHPIQYYAPLYRQLAATGVDLTVYYALRPSPEEQGVGFGVPFEWDVDLLSGYEHVWLRNVARRPTVGNFTGCDTPDVRREIRQGRYDAFLVLGWHSRTYWQAMTASWASGTPVMVRGDSQLEGKANWRKALVKGALYPRFIKRFAVCLGVGERSEAYFRRYGARCVMRAPHFVDNEFFAGRAAAARAEAARLKGEWDIHADAIVCLFVGKLVPKKRPLDVVRAVAAAGLPNVDLVMAGDGELRAACEEEARRHGVRLRVLGFLNQSRLPAAYAVADLLVMASDARETWGLVVNEAMACGLPAIVSSAAGCAPDLVVEGETGRTFAVGDVEGLAARLRDLAFDPESRRRMGEGARRRVAAYSVEAAAQGVVAATAYAREQRGRA